MKINVTTTPSAPDLATISQGIQDYNRAYIPEAMVVEPDTKFAVFAKNEHNEVMGGIRACAFWNYCIIELLWLDSSCRGSGVGRQLMAAAEQFAQEKGFQYMRTETLDFQAKPFYEKLGYQVYGELPDCPKGHTTYCLVKQLTS